MAAPDEATAPAKPQGEPGAAEQLNVVDTPTSPSSAFALSRFEFETGRGNEGTKILMVEWVTSQSMPAQGKQDQDGEDGADSAAGGDWEVSWEGKTTVLPIRDADLENSSDTRRVYFLLPPGAPVPALVTIAQRVKGTAARSGGKVLRTKPMPAIFPAELVAGGRNEVGKRGVLHTLWAKKRLAELVAEITAEMKTNVESVGLEMALQERQWIVDHFGLTPSSAEGLPERSKLHIPQTPTSPTGPRSPIGGRLGEKLRGLKLATSPAELAAASQASRTTALSTQFAISPDSSDVAVSSFASFGRTLSQESGNGGVASLNAIVGSRAAAGDGEDNTEEELFALPMSPRSPEMKKSPFSLL